MPLKSLLVSMEITTSGRAHDCRYNKNHRLVKGVKRLTIKSDGDEHHYCLACAKAFLTASTVKLAGLRAEVEALTIVGT